jgi:hypothetical protein
MYLFWNDSYLLGCVVREMSQLALEPMLVDPVEQHPLMLLQPHLTVPTK